ncbi:MAG: AAA family ATPase [Phycisphaerales bacterium]
MADSTFLRRVLLSNYKSIAKCSVQLGPLNFLVGPNGAGKSNFLDALRFVADALNTSLDQALRERGGIAVVRRRSSGHASHVGIRLEFMLPNGCSGYYAFRIGPLPTGGFEVQREECRICDPALSNVWFYHVDRGQVIESQPAIVPAAASNRLFLVAASGLPEFRALYDALSRMGFYHLNPDEIRDLQSSDTGQMLFRDGRNLPSVLEALRRDSPATKDRVVEFLSSVVPEIVDVTTKHLGNRETLEFHQRIHPDGSIWKFLAENMSDGTLRALGVLTALLQSTDGGARRVPLVGIDEPEMAVHPGAAGVLRDAMRTAAQVTQVIVTSHSPDLLDDKDISDDWVFSVVSENGETKIGPLSEADRSLMRDRLFTAGELLKQGQLMPDMEAIRQTPPEQLELFGGET